MCMLLLQRRTVDNLKQGGCIARDGLNEQGGAPHVAGANECDDTNEREKSW